ncbi:MAG: DUF3187 family protein [Dokdonella sp.]|nr:MAG: DUF3187 family protein [Dokdonella sp.]
MAECGLARLRGAVAALCITGGLAAAGAQAAAAEAWLPYRDANPFVAASGLPFAPPVAPAGSWRVEAIVSASNTELATRAGAESLFYDAEMHEVRILLTHAFAEHWLARATLGSVSVGKGFLDGFIEDWHHAFGLSNGDRGRLHGNGHEIRYDDGHAQVALARSLRTTTPLLLDVAWHQPLREGRWLLGATVKLPTSHASVLVDDRAIDASLWLAAHGSAAQTRLPWGLRLGWMQRGDTELLPQRAHGQVPFLDARMGWKLTPAWDVSAQLQWHGALYDSHIDYLRQASTLTLSSGWRWRNGWTLRGGVVEDVPALHAQDVTLFLTLAR